MNSARRQLEQIGLGRMAREIQAACRPSLRFAAGKRSAQPISRLGGRPNLPKDIPWPVWQDGLPLSFIAQLDLAALPPVRGLRVPRTGSMFFFYDAESQPWGFDPKDKGGAQVMYCPSPLAENPLRAPHRDLDDEVRFRGLALAATPETSFPDANNGIFRKYQATEEEYDAYENFRYSSTAPVHRVGGNPDLIQSDLRLQAQLVFHGIYCGRPNGFKEGRRLGLDAEAGDWLLLLQVDSEERAGMMWGDLGRIYFMIHKDDLRRRRFENVVLILQCS